MKEGVDELTASVGEPKRRWRFAGTKLALLFAGLGLLAGVTSLALQFVGLRKLEGRVRELEWTNLIQSLDSLDRVEPKVGPIQFLQRGFSITFTKVEYIPAGLHLTGHIGNHNQLWVSSLTLDFSASELRGSKRRYFFDSQSTNPFMFLPEQVGQAQAPTIPVLSPGEEEPFEVTIPNVTQRADGLDLVVTFSGERYSYGK